MKCVRAISLMGNAPTRVRVRPFTIAFPSLSHFASCQFSIVSYLNKGTTKNKCMKSLNLPHTVCVCTCYISWKYTFLVSNDFGYYFITYTVDYGLYEYIFITSVVCQGACVWVPDPEAVWVSAQLLHDYHPGDQQISIQLSDGRVRHIHTYDTGMKPWGLAERC